MCIFITLLVYGHFIKISFVKKGWKYTFRDILLEIAIEKWRKLFYTKALQIQAISWFLLRRSIQPKMETLSFPHYVCLIKYSSILKEFWHFPRNQSLEVKNLIPSSQILVSKIEMDLTDCVLRPAGNQAPCCPSLNLPVSLPTPGEWGGEQK